MNKVVKKIDQISVSRLYDFIDASNTKIIGDDKLDITFVAAVKILKKINVIGNNITEERVIRDMLDR